MSRAMEFVLSSGWRLGLTVGVIACVVPLTLVAAFDAGSLTRDLVAAGIQLGVIIVGLTIILHPAAQAVWSVSRRVANDRPIGFVLTARRGWRLLVLSIVNLGCAATLLAFRSQWWWFELAKWGAICAMVWLTLVMLWPCLDAAVAKLLYGPLVDARHPTPQENARVDAILRQLVPRFGLRSMPWVLITGGHGKENGQACSSVITIGASVVEDWPDDARTGLVGHELAHVALDHGRAVANLATWGISSMFSASVVFVWLPSTNTDQGTSLSIALGSIGGVLWITLQVFLFLYAVSRSNYPCEVEADAFVVGRGLGAELAACVRMLDADEARHGFWGWLLRTHPSRAERLQRALGDVGEVGANGSPVGFGQAARPH